MTTGYQFAHVDSWARSRSGGKKWTAADIVAEAERSPGACPHIDSPLPPVLLYGVMPRQALIEAEAWADAAQDAKGRRLKKDGCCLLAGVLSFPADRIAEWPALRDASVEWLKKVYGDRLKSVVEHLDEEHPHVHYFVVPRPGERFGSIHPGKNAIDQERGRGGSKKDQNKAYREAMRHWQDDYWAEVASSHGLARLGPGRLRLTRAEWKARQAAAELLAGEKAKIERAGELINLAQGNLAETIKMAEAERQMQVAARRELEEIMQKIKREDETRAREISQAVQDRVTIARVSAERQKAWQKRRDEFLIPPKELSHSQAELRRELAKEYEYLMYPQDVRRRAVEASRDGGKALRDIVHEQREGRKTESQWERQAHYLRDQAAELKPWQLLEKARVSTELRKAEAALASARAKQKSLALAEKKLIASCPADFVARYRYQKEDEREKAIAELLRREVAEAEAERREATETKERRKRMAMQPVPAKEKKPGGWVPPSPN